MHTIWLADVTMTFFISLTCQRIAIQKIKKIAFDRNSTSTGVDLTFNFGLNCSICL